MEQDIYDTEQEIKELELKKKLYPRLASWFESQIIERLEFIEKMKWLWYTVAYNNSRPNDEDSFYPKSIINEKI
jgi:hypothetical protein